MENTIRTRRIHFSLLFDWKSDLGQSWRHLRDILGRLGKIFEPSWPSTWVHLGPQDGSWAAQEPPERSLQNTQEASWSQEPPKSRPEPSKTPQGGAQTPSKPRFSRKHGGGNAALPRWRSAPGPKAPRCVSTFSAPCLCIHPLHSPSTLILYIPPLHSPIYTHIYTHNQHI